MKREEAIKIVRNIYQTDKEKEALGILIPELRESEDERIRKEIIKFIQDFCNPCDPDCDKWIAYLEKQKEQKPVNHNFTTWHRDVVYSAMCDKNLDEGLRCNLEVVYKTIKELVDRTPVVEEQKPAWSEEDETRLTNIIMAIRAFYRCGREDLVDYVKSLRPQPKQNPAEWSEEDEKMLDAMIDMVSNSLYEPLCPREGMLAWLKSLRRQRAEENLPKDLEEAANRFAVFYDQGTCDGIAQDCFIAGAKWDRSQMMEEAVEKTVFQITRKRTPVVMFTLDANEYKDGDKVRLIIVKEDKK